jgi:hypothetical protein
MFYKILKKFVIYLFVWMVFFSIVDKVKADLYYDTYQGTGATPSFPGNGGSLTYPTKLSSGTISSIDYNWGSGVVLDSGRNETVIVHMYGYITIPGSGSQDIQFYLYADDGVYMKLDDTVVINDWQEQGPGMWNYVSTDQTLTGGQTYYIDMWWYENGGGAAVKLYWDQTGSVAIVPASTYSLTEPTPTSAATSTQTSLRTTTRNITNSGNAIYIDQAGTNLDLDVLQDGDDNLIAGTSTTSSTITDANISGDYNTVNLSQKSDNNVLLFGVNGDHNDLTVSQGDNVNDTGGHRAIVDVTGNYNSTSLTQYDTGFGSGQFADINISGNDNTITSTQRETDKMLFIDVNGSDNTITTDQKDSGQHFLDITVGSNQTVSVTQQGIGDHAATVDMGGYSAGLSLDQNSSTDQNYVLEQTCANVSGCGTTTVTQN